MPDKNELIQALKENIATKAQFIENLVEELYEKDKFFKSIDRDLLNIQQSDLMSIMWKRNEFGFTEQEYGTLEGVLNLIDAISDVLTT